MTTPKAITMMAFLFMCGVVLSFILGGVWFDTATQSILSSLTAFKTYNVLGLFKIPWVNVDFFTVGIPKLVTFDFAFFGGTYGVIQYFMYILSIGVIWGILVVVIGVVFNLWQRAV